MNFTTPETAADLPTDPIEIIKFLQCQIIGFYDEHPIITRDEKTSLAEWIESVVAKAEAPPTSAYVAGFMFNDDLSQVLLIRKLKPVWQAGKLNGVGGKIESGETPLIAMNREFIEEAGQNALSWRHFLNMAGRNDCGESFTVDFFAGRITHSDLGIFESQEAEKLEVVAVKSLHALRADVVENLPWLIALAIDCIADGRPSFVRAIY